MKHSFDGKLKNQTQRLKSLELTRQFAERRSDMGPRMHHVTEVPGRHLRALRVLCGLKQSELAERAGVGRKTISRAERGAKLNPTIRAAIERALAMLVPQ